MNINRALSIQCAQKKTLESVAFSIPIFVTNGLSPCKSSSNSISIWKYTRRASSNYVSRSNKISMKTSASPASASSVSARKKKSKTSEKVSTESAESAKDSEETVFEEPLSTKVSVNYDAESIMVLEGLEPVRKRPGMYIGSTGLRGLHQLVYEVVDNAVDEALAGYCTDIVIVLDTEGSVSVVDNGRGIPIDVHSRTGKSALETVLTVLHAGGKFGQGGYKVSGGLHGVGLSVVNALSENLGVTVWRSDICYDMQFSRGIVQTPLRSSKHSADSDEILVPKTRADGSTYSGTRVVFHPDPTIFKSVTDFDYDTLAHRFEELAFLNANLSISFRDERSKDSSKWRAETYCHKGGMAEYVEFLCKDKTVMHNPPIVFTKVIDGVEVEIALQWSSNSYSDLIIGFANNIRTMEGGSHVDGMKSALTRTINSAGRKAGKIKESQSNLGGDFLREGLTAIVSVKVPDPEFEGQTKSKLGNPEVRSIADKVTAEGLNDYFEIYPKVLSDVIDKARAAYDAAQAAKSARDLVRRKSVLESSTLPGKLSDCSSREPEKCEVFIVEGDSAGGSAKQARERSFQAILPLRGKILNIEKSEDAKMYKNTEIQALINALGLGLRGEDFKLEQLRYHRVVIMTDADVDGAHIRTLLLTFFFRYQRQLIESGHVFIACPPLYKVQVGKKATYLFSFAELEDFKAKLGQRASSMQVQRFKGLGEMMPQQLWDTTMDPETRRMKQVEVSDAAAADRMFTLLMGDQVPPRRDFIERHSSSLDLSALDF